MELDLSGKAAVVTGSSRGLGREVAVALSARGADTVLFARDGQSLEETAEMVKRNGRDPLVVAGDVSNPQDIDSLKVASKERFGNISILVNAAGTFGPIALVTDSDPLDWINTVLTNAVGPYLTSNAFVPDMVAAGWGRVVNVSSAAAFMDPGPLNSAYSVSKAALNRFTRHLSSELADTGVTANVIHPGSLRTPMWSDIRSKVQTVPAATTLRGWVELVDETGGDSMEEAVSLILSLVDPASTINGEFCWPDNMVISDPIPSW
jgi:NAD(P)-dependent dehydrogenase (short-subunit alcohol dehydrogenase family)